MSGQEARVWSVNEGLWRGTITATATGIHVVLNWHGRPFIDSANNMQTREYTPDELEKKADEFVAVAGLFHEIAAAARKLGAK